MRVIIPDAMITGYEERDSKKEGAGKYAIVRFNDSVGVACDVVDRSPERFPFYTSMTLGDFICNVRGSKFGTQIEVVDFKIKGKVKMTIESVS